uniref:SDR family NAD(P)-dependent oxidoreductase n=1 Tax=Streptomyces ipomoeae TaxID=103232 RepID=UPI0038D3614E
MTINISLDNQAAFVTGAGSGLGLAAAQAFAEAGAAVALADRDLDAVQAAAEQLTAAGHRAIALRCDVADESDVARAVDQTVSAFGRLDAAYNNAGIQAPVSETADADGDDFDRVIAVNLRHGQGATVAVVPHRDPVRLRDDHRVPYGPVKGPAPLQRFPGRAGDRRLHEPPLARVRQPHAVRLTPRVLFPGHPEHLTGPVEVRRHRALDAVHTQQRVATPVFLAPETLHRTPRSAARERSMRHTHRGGRARVAGHRPRLLGVGVRRPAPDRHRQPVPLRRTERLNPYGEGDGHVRTHTALDHNGERVYGDRGTGPGKEVAVIGASAI